MVTSCIEMCLLQLRYGNCLPLRPPKKIPLLPIKSGSSGLMRKLGYSQQTEGIIQCASASPITSYAMSSNWKISSLHDEACCVL